MFKHFAVKNNCSLHNYFVSEIANQNTLENLLDFGAIYLNGRRLENDMQVALKSGDILRVHFNPRRFPAAKNEIWGRVKFENNDFVVVNKPSGLPMHPTLDNAKENLLRLLGEGYFLTHRLDVETSGLVVVAKTREFQRRFNFWLEKKRVKKIYETEVEADGDTVNLFPGLYRHYMLKSKTAPKIVVNQPGENSLECLLEVLSVEDCKLEIQLHTGRTHQIRAQLSCLGFPVIGDTLYGSSACNSEFGLRCKKLQFSDFDFNC